MITNYKRPIITAGNDFYLNITMTELIDGDIENFDLTKCTSVECYLICASHNTKINLDFEILDVPDHNVIKAFVDNRMLHNTSYGIGIEGEYEDGLHWKWFCLPKEGLLIIPNTSGQSIPTEVEYIDLACRVGFGIDMSDYYTKEDVDAIFEYYYTTEQTDNLLAGKQDTLVSGENIKTINNISLLGSGNIDIQGGGGSQVQADWTEDDTTSPAYIQHKPDLSQYATTQDLDDKQDTLQSGVNIKTINNISLLGSGNIDIQGGGGSSEDTDTLAEASIKQVQELEQGMTQLKVDIDKSITELETTVDNKLEEASKEAEDKDLVTAEALNDLEANKQELLVSGINIKTINNQSLLGSGNIDIQGGGGVQSDWNETDTTSLAYIQNKPNMNDYATTASLAAVATSGDYTDLINTPTIPAAQINSDWNSNSGVSQILNKPDLSNYVQSSSLASVATSGDYTDLINTPTIPAAQVSSDWNSNSGVSQILNKPDLTYKVGSTTQNMQIEVVNALPAQPSQNVLYIVI